MHCYYSYCCLLIQYCLLLLLLTGAACYHCCLLVLLYWLLAASPILAIDYSYYVISEIKGFTSIKRRQCVLQHLLHGHKKENK